MTFELIPVPTDALEAVGIIPGVMAEAFVDGKRIVIQKAEDDAFCKSYNEDCEDLPVLLSLLRRMPERADGRR